MSGGHYERLKPHLGPGRRALILINPDPDSLASAWALAQLFRRRGSEARIAFAKPNTRLENRSMVRALRIPTVTFAPELLAADTSLCLVDGQPNQFPELGRRAWHVVIDHHPAVARYRHEYADIRPEVGATSSLMSEYLEEARVRVSPRLATALCYGIVTDTDHFQRTVNQLDADAFSRLLPRADIGLLRAIDQAEIPLRQLSYFDLALHRLRVHSRRAVIHLGAADSADIAVILADFFVRVAGIQFVAVSVIAQEKLVVILRSRDARKDAGKVASVRFADLGSGGGHRYAARAELPLANLPPEVKVYSPDAVEKFIDRRLSSPK